MATVSQQALGYRFERYASDAEVGYRALIVNVVSVPTELHYDPERMELPTYSADGLLHRLTVQHPWHGTTQYQTAVGHIILRDRKQKVVEAFSCGGLLDIEVLAERTHCTITSPAPIFALVSETEETNLSYATSLVMELEAQLARRRVRWGLDDAGYQQHLASVDPLHLYAAGLDAVEEQLGHTPAACRGERHYRLLALVHKAQRAPVLAGLLLRPTPTPTLETLL